jgi:hypothetical protein
MCLAMMANHSLITSCTIIFHNAINLSLCHSLKKMTFLAFSFISFIVICGSPLLASSPLNSLDLDGDGKPDRVVFEGSPGGYAFTVTVNGIRYDGDGDHISGKFEIVDIDSTDGLREIAIPQSGPSDDYSTTFLIYRQGKIQKIGKIPGTYDLKVDGAGIIHTMVRGKILHTWFFPGAFVLDKKHIPHMVEQPLYPMETPYVGERGYLRYTMGTECTTKQSFQLRASPTDSTIVRTLNPGEKFKIMASDNKRWCVVQTSMGTWGWFEVVRYNKVVPLGIEAGELMDGLCMAD